MENKQFQYEVDCEVQNYVGMIVDDFFSGSLDLPRWRTCQIPDPRTATSVKIPTQGKAL